MQGVGCGVGVGGGVKFLYKRPVSMRNRAKCRVGGRGGSKFGFVHQSVRNRSWLVKPCLANDTGVIERL